MHPLIKLLRPYQYYKNILVFLPIIFAAQILNIQAVLLTLLGFVGLCLVSSANYVINDLIDREKDRKHPEKKNRPIASGQVRAFTAWLLMIALLILGMGIGFYLSLPFGLLMVTFFVFTLCYSLFLKEEPFVDVLMIAINFMLRAVMGGFVITSGFMPYVPISSWLILGTFFLALFLAISKRESDLRFLGREATSHRKVLRYYDIPTTQGIRLISTTLLIMAYALYAFYSRYHLLLVSIPVVLYAVFRYSQLLTQGSPVGRNPHLVFTDGRMVSAIVLWIVIIFLSIYVTGAFL